MNKHLASIQSSLNESIYSISKRFDIFDDQLAKLSEENAKTASRCAALESNYSKLSSPTTSRAVNTVNQDELIDEIEERVKRRKNVVIYGLDADNPKGESHDLTRIKSAIGSLNLDAISIQRYMRISKFSDSLANSRPLKIIMSSQTDVDKLLELFQACKRDKTLPQGLAKTSRSKGTGPCCRGRSLQT